MARPLEAHPKGPVHAVLRRQKAIPAHVGAAALVPPAAVARSKEWRWGGLMNNLLIAIAVFVITVVGALFAVPYFVDWNSYRSNFEEEASRVVGREVQVDGDVTLHLLPTPYFRLEKVRIADAKADLTFFKAESLSIRLSIPPILRGIVEANEIEFQRPILRLALDAKDAWNWQSFAQALSSGGYMPSNVTLTSLKIAEGVLALHGPDGSERTRLEGLNGELSAPALDGPYRFRGTFVSGGAEREIRLATAAPEADGSVRLRASLRLMDTGAAYLLDARVADLMGKPRVEGELTARLPIAGLWQPLPQGSAAARKRAGADDEDKLEKSEVAFDLKAAVKADVAGVQLSDLSLTFEQDGRPQIVSGTVRANWRSELVLDMNIASRWLDLDRITGASEQSGPIESIAKFSARLRDLIPGYGKAQVTLAIDQASLGHESIGPVHLLLKRSDERLEIQELRVALPGGSRGELQGTILSTVQSTAQSVVFDGRLGLRGASIARFLTWATGNALPIDARADGAFGLRTQITAGNGQVAARDLVGNLSGTTLAGTAQYRWDSSRPELSVALEGPQIDARAFIPAGASLADLFDFLLNRPEAQRQGQAKPGWGNLQSDLLLRVSAGQLATAGRVYRDVAAAMELKDGHLRQLRLRLSGEEGYSVELEGSVDDAATRPKGSLRGVVMADAAGVAPLIELAGVPVTLRPADDRGQAMAPLRLAGSMTFGGRTATSADLIADGEAGGAAVKLNARFDGSAGGWRAGPADVTTAIDSADGAKVAKLLPTAPTPARAGPGRILIKAAGVPDEGLTTLASFDAGDVALGFRGKVVPVDTGLKTAGDVDFNADDGAPLAALIGLSPPLRLDGVPISGRLTLALEDGTIDIDKLAATIGGSRLAGRIKLFRTADQRRIDASLDTDELSIAKLLAPLLDQRLAITGVAEAAILGRQAIWPEEPFAAAVFDSFAGNVRLTSKRLTLADGIALERAKLDVALAPGSIEIQDITGAALGGQFKARVSLAKVTGGAEMRGTLAFGAALEAFSDTSPPRASGPLRGTLEFAGRGSNPRALMPTLQGQGKIEFGEARLDTLWPGAISLAADAALKAEPDKMAATVRRDLASSLSTGNLSLDQKAVALEIGDGQLRVKSFAIDTREGRATGIASLDLKALTFDSQWRLEAKTGVAGTSGKQLPAVTVVYRGPVSALGAIEPRIDSAALEQELSARKIERDVEELERLRRLDEQRRQMDAERLRKQFEQAPPVQRPPSPSSVPVAPSSREPRPAAPG
ncbi:MAG: AsmA family protein [Hyphomonadaceae bacterium]|nr:AsmA family protein [Hyphomonadaceae bacterium]